MLTLLQNSAFHESPVLDGYFSNTMNGSFRCRLHTVTCTRHAASGAAAASLPARRVAAPVASAVGPVAVQPPAGRLARHRVALPARAELDGSDGLRAAAAGAADGV